jgi:hypothetical protein
MVIVDEFWWLRLGYATFEFYEVSKTPETHYTTRTRKIKNTHNTHMQNFRNARNWNIRHLNQRIPASWSKTLQLQQNGSNLRQNNKRKLHNPETCSVQLCGCCAWLRVLDIIQASIGARNNQDNHVFVVNHCSVILVFDVRDRQSLINANSIYIDFFVDFLGRRRAGSHQNVSI